MGAFPIRQIKTILESGSVIRTVLLNTGVVGLETINSLGHRMRGTFTKEAAQAITSSWSALLAGGGEEIKAEWIHVPENQIINSAEEGGQDTKFKFEKGQYVNRVSGEPIPLDEPVIIFRARDRHALAVLEHYLFLAKDDHHKKAILERMGEFAQFKRDHGDKMKEPGTTRHIALKTDGE